MSAQHTPGPWAIGRDDRPGMEWNNHIVQAHNTNITVCFMAHSGNDDNSQSEADAHLIAAAPDLLAALEVLLRDMQAVDAAGQYGPELAPGIYQAARAVAKATWVQP